MMLMDAETFGKCQVPSVLYRWWTLAWVVMDLKEQTQLSVGYAIFASPGSTFDVPEMIPLSSSEEMRVCLSKRKEINRGF